MTKIAYIMTRFPVFTETFILYEILELEKLGIQIEVYPLLRENESVEHPEADNIVKRAHYHPFISISIIKANWHFIRHSSCTYFKVLKEVVLGTLGNVNGFIVAISIFPKSVLFAYKMEKQGISHIHVHFANHPAVTALIIHRLTNIPFSITAHAFDIFKERDLCMMNRKFDASAFIVTISNYNKELIIRKYGQSLRDKINVIFCGVDTEVFSPSSEPHTKGPLHILSVASLEEKKGHKYLLEACRLLSNRGVDFVCHLVGDGTLRAQIENQITEASLENKVILHGPLNRIDVVKMMQSIDIVVLTSVQTKSGDQEGIPVVLMEAMAMGLPVVASKLSGIPELVETEQNGILVPQRGSIEIADAIQKLIEDVDLRHRLGQTGREKILREFNLQINVAKLSKLFLKKEKNEK